MGPPHRRLRAQGARGDRERAFSEQINHSQGDKEIRETRNSKGGFTDSVARRPTSWVENGPAAQTTPSTRREIEEIERGYFQSRPGDYESSRAEAWEARCHGRLGSSQKIVMSGVPPVA
jgi:hypothetical protein